jgi:trk system potassium uptake protein TrkH
LWLGHDVSLGRAAYHGVFHAVSAFNNPGFAHYPDNLIGFATDPFICLPIAAAVILAGIGFPVIFELRKEIGTPRADTRKIPTTVIESG